MSDHISTDEADEIMWAEPLATQDVSEHRWYTKQLVVFDRHGDTMGFHYLKPASELQEDQDCYEADPVPIFPVIAREVTSTVYEAA